MTKLLLKTVREVSIGGSFSNSFVFQPGGSGNGPSVFSDWGDLINALTAARVASGGNGFFIIQFDDSVVTPCVIPPGNYDMINVTWQGIPRDGGLFAEVSVPEGVTFTRLRRLSGLLSVTFTGVTPPVSDFGLLNTFQIDDGCSLSCSGTGTFISIASAVTVFVFVNKSSSFQTGSTECLGLPVSGASVILFPFNDSAINQDTISGVAGSSLIIPVSDTASVFSVVQTNFFGTKTPSYDGFWRMEPRAAVTAPIGSLNVGKLYKYNTTAGAIIQPLPSAATIFPGDTIVFKKVAGANTLTISPDGTDTIDGASSLILSGTTESAILVRGEQASSDWSVL